ncbi:apolipoprotein N-acyltransferase [Zhengella mangrovi]|uniref:Apolipoprotein N-acyltransferase n=1 Tax=Zhengella mangrovi TaxID=1982044 RepID=A0A2G1QU10_9HYPH|nr:apolipoprotein N-acyltransferase [Zhengella mangrovi]PHP69037.1 apolipoprotein N-acyltransferase [Zhengella mangrovi]
MERLSGRIILLWGWKRWTVAFLAGVLAVLAQPPFDFFAVCFVSFPVLVWLLDGAAGDEARGPVSRILPFFGIGWWFGFGYFVAGLWWIGNALLVEADSFAWAMPFAVVGLPAVLALFYGLACALARLLWRHDLGRIFALAFGFGAAEWARAVLFTGFPWNAIGQAAMPVPLLMQSAAVIGLFGMNALSVYVFASPALLGGRRWRRTGLAVALALVLAHVGFGYWRLAQPDAGDVPTVRVRLVQPSIAQDLKWNPETRGRIFETYLAMTAARPEDGGPAPQLIVWPETAVPWLLTERPEVLSAIGATLADDQVLLAGAVRAEGDVSSQSARFYNSITAINGKGEIIEAADKMHLVPFGEYLPFSGLLSAAGLEQVAHAPGQFTPAASRHTMDLPDGITALPLVCYEVIFPFEAGRAEGKPANLIVNVTNDAWYGRTPGPWQHFRQAQIRAVELGLPLLRAANNGISAYVDPKGRVIEALALDSVGVIDAKVRLERLDASFGNILVNSVFANMLALFMALVFAIAARVRPN